MQQKAKPTTLKKPTRLLGFRRPGVSSICWALEPSVVVNDGYEHTRRGYQEVDRIFTPALQDCQKEGATYFIQYILTRVEQEGWTITQKFWMGESESLYTDLSHIRLESFYRIVQLDSSSAISDDWANTVREVLFCFDQWDASHDCHPFWPDTLSRLNARKLDTRETLAAPYDTGFTAAQGNLSRSHA